MEIALCDETALILLSGLSFFANNYSLTKLQDDLGQFFLGGGGRGWEELAKI